MTRLEALSMDAKKRKALEAAGWRFGDAGDFLGMTDEERQFLDARVEAALAVRRQRQAVKMSQKELASRMKTSQPCVAKIERAAGDVSFDHILRAFSAVGGRIRVKPVEGRRGRKARRRSGGVSRRKGERASAGGIAEVEIELVGSNS